MSSDAGWYPDPGGQPGMYRYWTGSAWTEAITANPQGTPPPPISGSQPLGGGSGAGGYGPSAGQGSYVPGSYGPGTDPYAPTKKRGNVGWWVGGIAALVVVALVLFFIVRGLTGGGQGPILPDLPGGPSATATPNICPPAATGSSLPTAPNQKPGWVSGGKLAYPALGDPWQDAVDNRVPWGALASEQMVVDQANYDGQDHDWVASIIVSDLFVGDGFASTKVAAETVLKCVLGTYYADTVVTPKEISSAQHNVDGHPGWLIETQLSFSVPGLNAKGERVLLLVVQTGDDDYSLFYASVPDTRSDLVPDARKALAGLQVG